jgi:S-adenosylmethionine hydrolase
MPRHVALLTDFGLADPYVGQMKGVLLSCAPDALVVDLCHRIKPFNVLQAGFFLAASQAYFPRETVFVAVVDPGVGGGRRIVLVEKGHKYFLAPDNGLLTFLLQGGESALARDLTPSKSEASATFHGRDIFAPLAARLANGEPSWRLGSDLPLECLVRAPESGPIPTPEGVRAAVLHVDRFGNCILNLRREAWTALAFGAKSPALASPSRRALTAVVTYERLAPGDIGIIEGSQGYLELAMNRRSASAELGLAPGDPVVIRLNPD